MRLISVGLLTALFVPLAALAQTVKQVEVTNLPAVQEVTGSVEVTNGLANPVEVTGDVTVTNLPTPTGAARYQFVGFTTAIFDGGQGVRTYTQSCQVDFLSTARMCTSEEVLNTVVWPEVPGEIRGWVRPVFQPTGALAQLDASGYAGQGTNGALSCSGWSFSSATVGGQHAG